MPKKTQPQLPKISVVTPVFNGAKTFEKTIKSLLAQNYPSLEYIVLDGGSNDGTVDIIKKYEKYIDFWRSHKDGGTGECINEGIERATGDIIAHLNSDDWYEKDALLTAGKAFANFPSLEVISCLARVFKEENGELEETYRFKRRTIDIVDNNIPEPTPNARFIKKNVFKKIGGYIEKDDNGKKLISSDLEFIWRLCLYKPKHLFIDKIVYNYLEHNDSLTFNSEYQNKIKLWSERAFFSKKYLTEQKDRLNNYWVEKLKNTHKKGVMREFLFQIKRGNLKLCVQLFKEGYKINQGNWITYFLRKLPVGLFYKI